MVKNIKDLLVGQTYENKFEDPDNRGRVIVDITLKDISCLDEKGNKITVPLTSIGVSEPIADLLNKRKVDFHVWDRVFTPILEEGDYLWFPIPASSYALRCEEIKLRSISVSKVDCKTGETLGYGPMIYPFYSKGFFFVSSEPMWIPQ